MLRAGFLLVILCCESMAQGVGSLPQPTGNFSIGTSTIRVDGESVSLWYPTQATGPTAPYAPTSLLSRIEKDGYYDQTAQTIRSWSSVRTHSIVGAKPLADRTPLLIFLPGAGVYGFQYTAITEEFASQGYAVAVLDYFSFDAPKRSYREDDFAATENDMARLAVVVLKSLSTNPEWRAHLRFDRVGIAGHSIGGAAAIGAARLDRRFVATSDLDGAPFGDSTQGAVAPVLVLRSKPIYSDTDLAKRGSTREQWDKKGDEARKTWLDFKAKSGDVPIEVLSVKGTGHFSFSDAPFVMPDSITRFGGEIIAPDRGQKVIAACMVEFFDHQLLTANKKLLQQCQGFPEVVSGIPPLSAPPK